MILDKLQEAKETILSMSKDAFEQKILDVKTFEQIKNTLQKESIRIGICGQVKAGKSTFVNAFVFGKNVLPVASSPMTASLCYITYGETPQVEVEFFSPEDWKELEKWAKEDHEDLKAKAAREILRDSKRVKSDLSNILGKKIKIDLTAISNYAGSDGEYTPLTKSITISLPHDILKTVNIVDTPGTNDPVVSRERRTLEFLKEADVVFLICYAGRPFDEADEELLRQVKNSAGRVIIIVNKKDLILKEEGSIEKVERRFKEELEKMAQSIKTQGGSPLILNMLEDAKNRIVFFSSLWALLGRMSEKEILSDENMSYYYENSKEEFPMLKKTEDFLQHSGLKEIETCLNEILKEKREILIRKPANILLSAYEKEIIEAKKEIDKIELELEAYNSTMEEIKREIDELNRIERKLKEMFSETERKVYNKINAIINSCRKSIDNKISSVCNTIKREIPNKGFFETHSNYRTKCESIFDGQISSAIRKIREIIIDNINMADEDIEKIMDGLFVEIDRLRVTLVISGDAFNNAIIQLKKEIPKKTDVKFSRSLSFETSGWWFIGTSSARDKILKQIEEQIDHLSKKVLDELNNLGEVICEKFVFIKGKLFGDVLPSVQQPLERAKNYHKEKESKKKELEDKKKLMEQRIKQSEDSYSIVKKKIEELILDQL